MGDRPDNVGLKEAQPLGAIERVLLRPRLWHLRRRRNSQLKEVAGHAVELYRLDSTRQREQATARLKGAAAVDQELIELERVLEPGNVGGRCPGCGLYSRRTRFCLRCGEQLPGGRRHTEALTASGAVLAIGAIALAWLLGGVNLGTQKEAASSATSGAAAARSHGPVKPRFKSLVATVKGSSIGVYRSPYANSPYTTLSNPNLDGAPLVFLVKNLQGSKWAHVLLPSRPNGSSGWIKLSRVSLTGHNFRMAIDLGEHRLTAWKGGKVFLRTPVGVGRAVTPTPPGLYYITELLKQPDPTGTYGPYAFGLSAHSNVLNEFAGRDGVLGIHGTNFPQGIGTDVSHGCIRLSNRAILKLARTLPVGTPVRIRRV